MDFLVLTRLFKLFKIRRGGGEMSPPPLSGLDCVGKMERCWQAARPELRAGFVSSKNRGQAQICAVREVGLTC